MRVHVAPALAALLAGGTPLLAGCAHPAVVEPPAQTLYASGPVASVKAGAGETAAEVLVQPGGGSREACGIRAYVTARTSVLRRTPAGAARGAVLADVGVGDSVEVYVTGPVALSCPAQGEASSLVLVGAVGL